MALETPYELKNPTENEFYDIEVHNSNMDIIDEEFKKLEDTKVATEEGKELITTTDIEKLAGIAESANNYMHPDTANTRHISDVEKEKLAGIAESANKYIHPVTSTMRHVTDAEKEKWNDREISQFINDSDYQTLTEVNALIAALAESAPETLDTLKEIATALGNDPNFATTMTSLLATKEALIKNATAKASIVDNDTLPISDSANSLKTKKVKFSVIKLILKNYFDTLYNNYIHPSNATTRHTTDAEKAKWNSADTHTRNKVNPHGVTKSNVGLSNVNNWGATGSVTDSSAVKYATAGAVQQTYARTTSNLNSVNALTTRTTELVEKIALLEGEIITIPLSSWVACTTDARYTKQFTTTTVNSYIGGIKGYTSYYEGGLMPDSYSDECNKIGCVDYNDSNNRIIIYATEALTKNIKVRI